MYPETVHGLVEEVMGSYKAFITWACSNRSDIDGYLTHLADKYGCPDLEKFTLGAAAVEARQFLETSFQAVAQQKTLLLRSLPMRVLGPVDPPVVPSGIIFRADTYNMGLLMLKLFLDLEPKGLVPKKSWWVDEYITIAKQMACLNPYERLHPDEAYNMYKAFVAKLDAVAHATAAAARPQPVTP